MGTLKSEKFTLSLSLSLGVKILTYGVNFDSETSEILLCHSLNSDISLFKIFWPLIYWVWNT